MQQSSSDALVGAAPPNPLVALLQDWRLFRNGMILGCVIAIVAVLVIGKKFTATGSFVPQGTRTGQLRGLAAQFGLDVAGSDGGESPFFYVELLRTNDVLTRVVNRKFTDGKTTGDYATFQEITKTDSALRDFEAIRELNKKMSVTADRRTGLVTFSVTEDSPAIALQLAQAMLAEISRYNRETRQSRAGAERRFVEGRLQQARREMVAAEDSLKVFLEKNRSYRSSPELTSEYDRIDRSVAHHASVVSSLAQNFEQTRLDEVRDTPVISIVQPPRLPGRHDPRGWVRAVILGALGGLFAALIFRSALQFARQLRGTPTLAGA